MNFLFKIHFSVGSPFFFNTDNFTPGRAQEIISNLHFCPQGKETQRVSASCQRPLAGWLQGLGSYDPAFEGCNSPSAYVIKASI